MGETGFPTPNLYRSACAECQRRKQKVGSPQTTSTFAQIRPDVSTLSNIGINGSQCNREWPCNHCLKRKVADKCRFLPSKEVNSPGQEVSRKQKRARSHDETETTLIGDDVNDGDESLGLEAMGYMAGSLLATLDSEVNKKKPAEELDWVTCDTCPQLERALRILPSRPQMDALVQSFFNNVNYHYYIIYPPIFLQEYQSWWERRSQNRPLALQWTCLLVMVCACATQHLDVDNRPQVELNLGESANELTEQYHNIARELSSVIPSGRYHLLNVQRMLHSIYWFKAEARFVEAWHDIGAAVREAQELGLHKESASDSMLEFDREMRRRVWCILDTWDWQFASGLCRPTIIDHTDIDVNLPNLTLEDLNPSPLLHMKLQSEVIGDLAARFSAPKNVVTLAEIEEYKGMIEAWFRSFPPVYSVDNPDKSVDHLHPWVSSHRFYIHTMAYLMILNPIRIHLAKPYTRASPKDELKVRADAVYYSLRNLDTTTQWVDETSHRDGRFHFIIFSLFDTATVLSTAIIKDTDQTVPRRDEILIAIHNAVKLLKRLNNISKTAKTSYEILSRLAQRVPRPPMLPLDGYRKRSKVSEVALPVVDHSSHSVHSGGWCRTASSEPTNFHEYGSDAASPSHMTSVYSATSGSTPQSHLDSEGYASPRISEGTSPSMSGHTVSSVPYSGGVDVDGLHHGYEIDGPPPTLAIGGLVPPGADIGGMVQPNVIIDGLAHPGMHTNLQHSDPQLAPNYGFDEITDAQLGEFSRLWNWQSLDLDFISSESVSGSGG
ncbi:Fc.00g004230.m01.CDS01 [Cosmosporella sp. VM-42]